ncbi:hypothetical protein BSMD_036770 [Bacillus subtilis Miyagi-4]|nr:hypothetical protein BSMD_036770 [Bacillus subtilis Miyagi-4]
MSILAIQTNLPTHDLKLFLVIFGIVKIYHIKGTEHRFILFVSADILYNPHISLNVISIANSDFFR